MGQRKYVCMVITYSKGKDQLGKVANPARGQLNREHEFFRVPVPRQPANLHAQAESGAYLRDSSRIPRRRPFIYLNRHTLSE